MATGRFDASSRATPRRQTGERCSPAARRGESAVCWRKPLAARTVIAHLKGRLEATGLDHAVIDVGGVGYLVGASTRTLAALGPVGEAATLFTEMLVAEDSIRLVGFARADERDWFRHLTGVQGVGARVALAILSVLDPAELARAVAAQDKASVARASGVGPKLAERIVRELKDKAGGIALGPAAAAHAIPAGAAADAVSALLNLGFRASEAANAVAAAEGELGAGASLDALVRLALRKAAR